MLADFLIGAGTLGVMMTGWLVLQAWVRRTSGEAGESCDALEGRFGCYGCIIKRRCRHDPVADQSPTPIS